MAKEKPKNWPHQIIYFLYQHYSETTTELNRFFYTKLGLADDNTTHKDKIKDILNALNREGYLTWKVIHIDDKGKWLADNYQGEFQSLPNLTLKNHRVEAQLTIKGLDYAIELKRDKEKHNIYRWATPSGTLFAFLAFFISLLTYVRGCNTKTNNQAPKVDIQLINTPQKKQLNEDTGHEYHLPLHTNQPTNSKDSTR